MSQMSLRTPALQLLTIRNSARFSGGDTPSTLPVPTATTRYRDGSGLRNAAGRRRTTQSGIVRALLGMSQCPRPPDALNTGPAPPGREREYSRPRSNTTFLLPLPSFQPMAHARVDVVSLRWTPTGDRSLAATRFACGVNPLLQNTGHLRRQHFIAPSRALLRDFVAPSHDDIHALLGDRN